MLNTVEEVKEMLIRRLEVESEVLSKLRKTRNTGTYTKFLENDMQFRTTRLSLLKSILFEISGDEEFREISKRLRNL